MSYDFTDCTQMKECRFTFEELRWDRALLFESKRLALENPNKFGPVWGTAIRDWFYGVDVYEFEQGVLRISHQLNGPIDSSTYAGRAPGSIHRLWLWSFRNIFGVTPRDMLHNMSQWHPYTLSVNTCLGAQTVTFWTDSILKACNLVTEKWLAIPDNGKNRWWQVWSLSRINRDHTVKPVLGDLMTYTNGLISDHQFYSSSLSA